MFRKSFKGFAIGFSVFILVAIGIIIVNDELKSFHDRETAIQQGIGTVEYPERLFGFLNKISDIRRTSPISSKWINEQIMVRTNFQRHSVYYFPKDKTYNAVLDNWMRLELGKMNARRATTREATEYYKNFLDTSTKYYFPFPWAYYLVKLLVVLGFSVVPLIFSFFASLLTVKFSLSVVATCLLLLAIMLRAQDNMIEFGTSTTGGKHSLSLFLLHMDKKTTGGGIIFEEGVWAWWGPLFNMKHGMILAPVGLTFGKGANGLRAEHLSILTVAMFKFGKITPMLMGFFNQAIVKDKSSFGWAKSAIYYDFPGFMGGFRADLDVWKEGQIWKKALNVGPIVKFRKKLGEKAAFIFQVSGTFTRPYTLRTQWEVDF